MSNPTVSGRSPRVLFLGMQGRFSFPSLRALLESGIEVCAIIIPASQHPGLEQPTIYRREQPRLARPRLPVLNSSLHNDIIQLAWERQIPLWEVAHMSDSLTISTLAAYQPDVICVACFSQRIPHSILTIPRFGCLNVHPSLLPANRGPMPLFWTFRQGCKQTGVTIHLMDEGMDTGDMLAQEIIDVLDGISYAQLELQCAMRGGELLARTIWDLYEGCAIRVPQDETQSTYHSFPSEEDFIVPVAGWNALHAHNFICGVAGWGESIKLQVGTEYFFVRGETSYSHENRCNEADVAYYWQGEELWVRCKVGWLGILNSTTSQ